MMHRTRRLPLIAAAVLTAVLMVSGCGGATPVGQAGPAPGAAPDRDATLRVALLISAQSWDPLRYSNPNAAAPFLTLAYDQLVELGPDFAPRPALVESWSVAPDGLEMTLELRDDVVFDGGAMLDADAVAANLDRARSEGSPLQSSLAEVSAVTATGPTSVRIDFSRPTFNMVERLAQDTRLSSVVDPQYLDDPGLATTPHGSGPYSLVSASTSETVFARRPAHWDTTSGLAARIELKVINDANARLNGLRSGQLDLVYTTAGQVEATRASARLVSFDDTTSIQVLGINYATGPLTDPLVRQAMNLAIDRQAIVAGAYENMCRPTQQIFAPVTGGWVAELDEPGRLAVDLPAARELMRQAGRENGLTIRLLYGAGSTSFSNAGQILQRQLAQIGITVELVEEPTSQAAIDFADGKADAWLGSLSAASESQLSLALNLEERGKGFGIPPLIAGPVAEAAATPVGPLRDERFQAISQSLADVPASLPMCNSPIWLGAAPTVVGIESMAYARGAGGVLDVRRVGLVGE